MNPRPCEHEPALLAADRAGALADAIADRPATAIADRSGAATGGGRPPWFEAALAGQDAATLPRADAAEVSRAEAAALPRVDAAALAAHLAGCAACAEALAVDRLLRGAAAAAAPALPDPAVLLFRARRAALAAARERALAPIRLAERLAVGGGAAVALLLALWRGPALLAALAGSVATAAGPAPSDPALAVALAVAGAALAFALLTATASRAEE